MRRLGCLLGLLAVAAGVVLLPAQTIVWDGGFTPAEYRLRFTDPAGRPVPGVALRVETAAGGACHLFPVDEFLPDTTPTSDADGRMLFHQAGTALFGGREHRNRLGMRWGDTRDPQYACVFVLAGREVGRVWYDDLAPWADDGTLPAVTRRWQPPAWPLREYTAHHHDWDARRRELFDGDRDGRLDREERTAAGYFNRLTDPPHETRDIKFVVVERTVTVSQP